MDDREDADWREFVRDVHQGLVPKVRGSAAVMSLVPEDGQIDAKFCVELGVAIMLDKPIIAVAMRGRPIPATLRRVAAFVVETDADPDTEAGQGEIAGLVNEVLTRLAHLDISADIGSEGTGRDRLLRPPGPLDQPARVGRAVER